ncbi:MAG: hypothetical protein M3R58_03090 [Pseudomonadota bacterium]|nr:hypothetical protein [Pseudomonadota bacterium]
MGFEKCETVVSSDFFTLDAIKDGLGSPLTNTGIKVLRSTVDAHGRYAPEESRSAFSYLGNVLRRRRGGGSDPRSGGPG